MLLKKLPDQFSVHFRREGVLHQVQKLTDPDYSFSGANDSGMENSLNMSWNQGANTPPVQPGRSWTIAGRKNISLLILIIIITTIYIALFKREKIT